MSASDGKQGGHNRNFKLIDCKTSNDSNSVKDGSQSKTDLYNGMMERRLSNEKPATSSSKNVLTPGFDCSSNPKELHM